MQFFSHPEFDDHEQVVFASDRESGLRAVIAIHSTRLGPALGGCRVWPYPDDAAALTDALRLSRGMTYKAALADLALGGGKSVVLADPRATKTPAMMRAMGRAVNQLAGRYIVAEDVGTTVADMDEIARETAHVSGVSSGTGDPSPATARGVFLAMQAAARHRWGTGLGGRTVSVTGLGNVGARLCIHLAEAGARLVVSDIRDDAVRRIVGDTGADAVDPGAAHAAEADVFAPCALGAGLNERSIPEIRAQIVCGAANNQLATPQDGDRLHRRGILYAPDYLVNAGGLIAVSRRRLGLTEADVDGKIGRIPETLTRILGMSDQQDLPTDRAADRVARDRLAQAA